MLGSTVLEVILGLAFTFFLLGTMTAQVNDLLSQLLNWRAQDLKKSLARMVGNDAARAAVGQRSAISRDEFVQMVTALPGDPKLKLRPQDLAVWFDRLVQEAAQAYRTRMRLVSFIVGTALVLTFGVDSLGFANRLWAEPALRASLNATANPTYSASPSDFAARSLAQATFPWGWTDVPANVGEWIRKALGLALTILAVSLGAEFWYNLLRGWSQMLYPPAAVPTPYSPTPYPPAPLPNNYIPPPANAGTHTGV